MTTIDEMKVALRKLRAAYPQSFASQTKQDSADMLAVWAEHFANVPAADLAKAINHIIDHHLSSFAPSIGEVKDVIKYRAWEGSLRMIEDQAAGRYGPETSEPIMIALREEPEAEAESLRRTAMTRLKARYDAGKYSNREYAEREQLIKTANADELRRLTWH